MTTPGTTTTTTDAGTAAAASPVLGPDAARSAGASALAAVAAAPAATADEGFTAGGDVDGPPLPTVAVYEDEDGRVHHASPFSKATRAHVAAGEWTEVDGSASPFDPTSKLVREVVAYLDENAGNEAEVKRVKAAEAAGEDRPTIRDWSADE